MKDKRCMLSKMSGQTEILQSLCNDGNIINKTKEIAYLLFRFKTTDYYRYIGGSFNRIKSTFT